MTLLSKRFAAFTFLSLILPMQAYAAECEFSVISEWQSGFTGSVTITNNSNSPIDGWDAQLNFADSTRIKHMWNADLASSNGGYNATSKHYNSQIGIGESVSFGFNGDKANPNSPATAPSLSGVCSTAPPADPPPSNTPLALCEYTIENEWTSGFIANVVVENQSDTTLSNWLVKLSYSDGTELSNAWRARAHTNSASEIVFKNANYNGELAPGARVEFGFNAVKGVGGESPSIPLIGGMCAPLSPTAPPVNTAPIARATASVVSGEAPLEVAFSGNGSSDAEGDDLTYLWVFSDSSTSTERNPSKLFSEPGIFPVLLTVNDGNADSETVALTIVVTEPEIEEPVDPEPPVIPDPPVNTPPVAFASASVQTGEAPLEVSFSAVESRDEDGNELTYLWTFSDSTTSTEANLSKVFTEAGQYQASLTVSDGEASSASVSLIITVTEPEIEEPVTPIPPVIPEPPVTPAAPTYSLDSDNSSLFFVTTKKEHALETHHFNQLSGDISDNNVASLYIDLSSVDTANTTRDERMRNFLFETSNFATATVQLTLEDEWLETFQE